VVGEDTHLSRLGGNVDLDNILGLVDGLRAGISLRLHSVRARNRQCVYSWFGWIDECRIVIPGEGEPSSA
jgi:hypothetical protein